MNNSFIENLKPTMFQLQCLKEIEKEIKEKGGWNEAKIGRRLGVNRSTINRYVRQCREAGIIASETEKFTLRGEEVLNYYKELEKKLYEYFEGIGVKEEKRYRSVETMFNGMDLDTLRIICEKEKIHLNYENIDGNAGKEIREIAYEKLSEYLKRGRWNVEFSVYHQASHCHVLSMADEGFEHPAVLYYEEEREYLELTIKEIKAYSKTKKNLLLSGHLQTIKCSSRNELWNLPIQEGKVRIPLCEFQYKKLSQEEITGQILLVMACSVGEKHMPESMAMLMIRM